MYSKKEELEKFRKFKGPLIDVRSPDEYYKGNLPNSINIPLFDNEERSKIGIIYKDYGKEKAVNKGLEFVANKIENLIENFIEALNFYKSNNITSKLEEPIMKIYCARGGMRSFSISWLLERYNLRNVTLKGGYKSYRKWTLDSFNKDFELVVIGGKTGTGKTKLLNEIKLNNGQILDLEGIACHKGSLLGKDLNNNQPSQKLFESLLYDALKNINLRKNIYLEAESSKIGNLHIPQPLWKKMLSSKKINIETTFESRVKFLLNDYKYAQLDNNFFKPLINGLKRRLSKKIIADWKQHIKNKDWKQLTESLLTNHYDPAYISNYEKKNQKIIKNFTFNKVTKSELNLLANKILNL